MPLPRWFEPVRGRWSRVRPTCSVQKPPALREPQHSAVRDDRHAGVPATSGSVGPIRRLANGGACGASKDGAGTQGALPLRLDGKIEAQSGPFGRPATIHAAMLRQVGQGWAWKACRAPPCLGPCQGSLRFGLGLQVGSRRLLRSQTMSRAASSTGLARSSPALEPKPAVAHLVSTCGCRRGAFLEVGVHRAPRCPGRTTAGRFALRTRRPPVRFHWKTTAAPPRRSSGGEATKSGLKGCVLRKQAPRAVHRASRGRWSLLVARPSWRPAGAQGRPPAGESALEGSSGGVLHVHPLAHRA